MAVINGVQLARLWAKALRDPVFKGTLFSNPLLAATNFKTLCANNPATHSPFPDPAQPNLNLLDMEEYGQPGLDFEHMPDSMLDAIITGTVSVAALWTPSKFFTPNQLGTALWDGTLEIE